MKNPEPCDLCGMVPTIDYFSHDGSWGVYCEEHHDERSLRAHSLESVVNTWNGDSTREGPCYYGCDGECDHRA